MPSPFASMRGTLSPWLDTCAFQCMATIRTGSWTLPGAPTPEGLHGHDICQNAAADRHRIGGIPQGRPPDNLQSHVSLPRNLAAGHLPERLSRPSMGSRTRVPMDRQPDVCAPSAVKAPTAGRPTDESGGDLETNSRRGLALFRQKTAAHERRIILEMHRLRRAISENQNGDESSCLGTQRRLLLLRAGETSLTEPIELGEAYRGCCLADRARRCPYGGRARTNTAS